MFKVALKISEFYLCAECLIFTLIPCIYFQECSISRVCSAFTRSAAFGVIANDWSTLARQLGIREDKIQKLRQDQMLDKKSIYDIFHDLLSEWKMAESKNATVSNLIKILDGIGWADISGIYNFCNVIK